MNNNPGRGQKIRRSALSLLNGMLDVLDPFNTARQGSPPPPSSNDESPPKNGRND